MLKYTSIIITTVLKMYLWKFNFCCICIIFMCFKCLFHVCLFVCACAHNIHWLDSELPVDERKQKDREERETLVLWKKPLVTLRYFTLELLITLKDWLWRWGHARVGCDSPQTTLLLQNCPGSLSLFLIRPAAYHEWVHLVNKKESKLQYTNVCTKTI